MDYYDPVKGMGTFREWVDCFWLEKYKQVWLDEIDLLEPYFRECPQNHETLSNLLVRVNRASVAESASVAELFTQIKAVIVGDQEKDATTVLLFTTTTSTTLIHTHLTFDFPTEKEEAGLGQFGFKVRKKVAVCTGRCACYRRTERGTDCVTL